MAAACSLTAAAFRADSTIDFIVVYFHHCAFCTCVVHGCDGGVEKYFVPAFDTYSVDLVINGHNHIYERTYPIRGGSTVSTNVPIGASWESAKGTTYITAGQSLYSFSAEDFYDGNEPSGAPTSVSTYINEYDPTTGATSITNETVTWSAIRYTGYCLLVIDSVPGNFGGSSTLRISGLDEAGGLLDQLELQR
ncbi:MAG TPA: hypothetical protein VMA73_27695 [Streptosporangiaceae bacterium]|nr:hypothetical protein [Streptosporangiaceae bacterium]